MALIRRERAGLTCSINKCEKDGKFCGSYRMIMYAVCFQASPAPLNLRAVRFITHVFFIIIDLLVLA